MKIRPERRSERPPLQVSLHYLLRVKVYPEHSTRHVYVFSQTREDVFHQISKH